MSDLEAIKKFITEKNATTLGEMFVLRNLVKEIIVRNAVESGSPEEYVMAIISPTIGTLDGMKAGDETFAFGIENAALFCNEIEKDALESLT